MYDVSALAQHRLQDDANKEHKKEGEEEGKKLLVDNIEHGIE